MYKRQLLGLAIKSFKPAIITIRTFITVTLVSLKPSPPIAPESRSNSKNASNIQRVNYQRYSMHTPSPYIRARAVNTQSPSSRSSSNTSCYSSVTSFIPASPAHGVKFTSLVHSTPTRWRLKTTSSKSAAPTYKLAYAEPVSVKTLRLKPESDEDQVYLLPASE